MRFISVLLLSSLLSFQSVAANTTALQSSEINQLFTPYHHLSPADLDVIEEAVRTILPLVPSDEAVPLRYRQLALDPQQDDYQEVLIGVAEFSLIFTMGAAGLWALHELTTLVAAQPTLSGALGGAAGFGATVLFEEIADAAKEEVVEESILIVERHEEHLAFEKELETELQRDLKEGTDVMYQHHALAYLLSRIDHLTENEEQDRTERVETFLVQYSLARNLFEIAQIVREDQPQIASELLHVSQDLLTAILYFDPKSSIAMVLLGRVEHRLKQFESAQTQFTPDWFERAVATEPENLNASLALMLIDIQQQQFEQASKRLQTYLKHNADINELHWMALNGLGYIAYRQGDLSQAIHYFRQSLALQPNQVSLRFLSDLYVKAQKNSCCCPKIIITTDDLFAVTGDYLKRLAEVDQTQRKKNPYYIKGRSLQENRRYFERYIQTGLKLFRQEQSIEGLSQAVAMYQIYLEQTPTMDLDQATQQALAKAVASHNKAPWGRISQQTVRAGQLLLGDWQQWDQLTSYPAWFGLSLPEKQ